MEKIELWGKSPRCWWCGKRGLHEYRPVQFNLFAKAYETTVCSEECARAVENAYRRVQKTFVLFPIGLISGMFLLVGSDLFHWKLWTFYLGLLLLGITVVVCPFATPQTTLMLGLKRSFVLVRIVGSGFILVAITLLILTVAK